MSRLLTRLGVRVLQRRDERLMPLVAACRERIMLGFKLVVSLFHVGMHLVEVGLRVLHILMQSVVTLLTALDRAIDRISLYPRGPPGSSSRPARRTGEARRRPRARSDAAARRAAWRYRCPT